MDLRTKKTIKDGIVHQEISGDSRYVEYAPGNGTVYRLMITRLDNFSLNTTAKIGSSIRGAALVSDVNGECRSMVTGNGTMVHYTRVEEKMGFNRVDSVIVAELLGHIFGLPYISSEEYSTWVTS